LSVGEPWLIDSFIHGPHGFWAGKSRKRDTSNK
jgi:hypothetical protein